MPSLPVLTVNELEAIDLYSGASPLFRAVSFSRGTVESLPPSVLSSLLVRDPGIYDEVDPETGRSLLLAFLLAQTPAFRDWGAGKELRVESEWPFIQVHHQETLESIRRRIIDAQEVGLILLAGGADPLRADAAGYTPLGAAFSRAWPRLLEAMLANPGVTPEVLASQEIQWCPGGAHAREEGDPEGLPWLHAAAALGDEGLVRVLLEGGYPPDVLASNGMSAMFFARHPAIARRLLAAGVPTHDSSGTPVRAYWSGLRSSQLPGAQHARLMAVLGRESPSPLEVFAALDRCRKNVFVAAWRKLKFDPGLLLDTPRGPRSLMEHLVHVVWTDPQRPAFPEEIFRLLAPKLDLARSNAAGCPDGMWMLWGALCARKAAGSPLPSRGVASCAQFAMDIYRRHHGAGAWQAIVADLPALYRSLAQNPDKPSKVDGSLFGGFLALLRQLNAEGGWEEACGQDPFLAPRLLATATAIAALEPASGFVYVGDPDELAIHDFIGKYLPADGLPMEAALLVGASMLNLASSCAVLVKGSSGIVRARAPFWSKQAAEVLACVGDYPPDAASEILLPALKTLAKTDKESVEPLAAKARMCIESIGLALVLPSGGDKAPRPLRL